MRPRDDQISFIIKPGRRGLSIGRKIREHHKTPPRPGVATVGTETIVSQPQVMKSALMAIRPVDDQLTDAVFELRNDMAKWSLR